MTAEEHKVHFASGKKLVSTVDRSGSCCMYITGNASPDVSLTIAATCWKRKKLCLQLLLIFNVTKYVTTKKTHSLS